MKFELVHDIMVFLVTAKDEEGLVKNEGASVNNIIYHFSENTAVHETIWLKCKLIRDMVVLVTSPPMRYLEPVGGF